MEQGLAMMYGGGEGNTITHYYAGAQKNKTKTKGQKMACKSKKKKGK